MSSSPRSRLVDQAVGFWRVETAEKNVCLVALKPERSGAARELNIERCSVPALSDLAAWNAQEDEVLLLDREGRVLVRMVRTGSDQFTSIDRRYRMSREPMV